MYQTTSKRPWVRRSPARELSFLRGLERRSDESLERQIVRRLSAAIESGGLPPGARLPSTRALAVRLSLARSTIVGAIEHLIAQGFLIARRGSGTYVRPDPEGGRTDTNANGVNPRHPAPDASASPVRASTRSVKDGPL